MFARIVHDNIILHFSLTPFTSHSEYVNHKCTHLRNGHFLGHLGDSNWCWYIVSGRFETFQINGIQNLHGKYSLISSSNWTNVLIKLNPCPTYIEQRWYILYMVQSFTLLQAPNSLLCLLQFTVYQIHSDI